MTAYKKEELHNLLVQETAQQAFDEGFIDEAIYENILQHHPDTLYTPNFFIRIGLALLTVIIGLATLILFGLFIYSGASGDGAFKVLLVILAVISYIALELLVNIKKYYNAGTDNILMLFTVGFAWAAYAFTGPNFNYLATTVFCVISTWLCYRFTNGLMGLVAYLFLLVSLYMLCMHLQAIKAIPFVLMAAAALVYWAAKQTYRMPASLYHRENITYISVLAVISFYLCGNYFFVNEVLSYQFYSTGQQAFTVPAAPFYWFCTLFIPVGYLLYGIRAKSLLFIRCGVILLVIGVATLHYYYVFMPTDILCMLGGIVLITVSSILIVYLRQQRRSFVLGNNRQTPEHLRNIEALVIAQAVSAAHIAPPQQGVQFGGGSSGGGGASGDY